MAQSDAHPTGCRFDPCWVRQHSSMEFDLDVVILSLQLIQEGQLPVSDERMQTSTGKLLI